MADGFVHTTSDGRFWTNKLEGEDASDLGVFETKDEAVEAGRAEARRRNTEHVVHNEDGSIAERNSYGNDPSDRPG